MFLNREKETERIREVVRMHKSHAKAILVYGLRRVGKTSLIQNALSGYEGTVISYLAVEDTYLSNIRQFAKCAADALNMPYLSSVADMNALFSIIADTGRKVVVVLDEYHLLKKSFRDGNLDSYFQRLVDRLKDNITFVFCGSYLSVMRNMGNYEEPMYGRFDLELHLRTFDYYDSSAFYSSLSSTEKIRYYSVFGGFPFVLERLQLEKGFEWNIKRAFLDSWDIVYSTINEILMTEINKLEYAGAILSYLKNGKARNNEIASVLNASASSVSKEVSRLTDMDLIEKNNPINRKDDAKKTLYKEIQQAWYNAAAAISKYHSSRAATEASDESFLLTKKKYECGQANAVEYNEARQNLVKARSDELQAKYEYLFRVKILDFYQGTPIE